MKDKMIGQILRKLGIIDSTTVKCTLEIQKQEKKDFGSILVEKKVLKRNFLEEVISAVKGDKSALLKIVNKKIGEILVSLHYADEEKVNEVVAHQTQITEKKKLGEILVEKGLVKIHHIKKALKVQKNLASILTISSLSFLIVQGCSPRIPLESSVGVVQNYSSSAITKVLSDGIASSINYHNDGTIAIANIPYFQQGSDNTCAQACMTSLLNYWGVNVSYQSVVNQTNSGNLPTDVVKITNFLRKNGLYAQDYREATINFLKDRVNKGTPVIILLDFGKLSYEHYVLVTGYNDKTEELLILDPVDGPNQRYSYQSIESMWENRSLEKIKIFGDKYSKIAFDVYSPQIIEQNKELAYKLNSNRNPAY